MERQAMYANYVAIARRMEVTELFTYNLKDFQKFRR
jgi:hypothetical protein